ncbi:MAG: type I 3-dehydroquinate dehydratase [Dehalococcoidales bacterium]|nr:type I 3-dehydroquinate dehydratase [Dehalococcoidales bacterium]
MRKPIICAVITNSDLKAVEKTNPFVDLFEVRIDLVGEGWQKLVKQLEKPWIGCNRMADDGGKWQGDEASRVEKLLEAAELGADTIDIELKTENLNYAVELIKGKAECLLSFHDWEKTPPLREMREIVHKQLAAGADACKIVTTAHSLEDNRKTLQLISEFPEVKMISFAMGQLGILSRVLCPLVGGDFTYASVEIGKESAPGQITVKELRKIYDILEPFGENRSMWNNR